MSQDYLKELLVCKTCGQSYTSNYRTCPHCEAEARAREITRNKKKKRPSPLVLLVSAALIVGGGCMFFVAFASDGMDVGREHMVEEVTTIQTISSSVTQQKAQIDSFIEETEPPAESDPPTEE